MSSNAQMAEFDSRLARLDRFGNIARFWMYVIGGLIACSIALAVAWKGSMDQLDAVIKHEQEDRDAIARLTTTTTHTDDDVTWIRRNLESRK